MENNRPRHEYYEFNQHFGLKKTFTGLNIDMFPDSNLT